MYSTVTRTATAGFQIEDEVLKKSSANKHNPSLADLLQRLRLINKEAEKQQEEEYVCRYSSYIIPSFDSGFVSIERR